MWAAGLILLQLVGGLPTVFLPDRETQLELLKDPTNYDNFWQYQGNKKTFNNRVVCDIATWSPGLSQDLKALMEGLLHVQPDQRWTAADVLASAWLAQDTDFQQNKTKQNLYLNAMQLRDPRHHDCHICKKGYDYYRPEHGKCDCIWTCENCGKPCNQCRNTCLIYKTCSSFPVSAIDIKI